MKSSGDICVRYRRERREPYDLSCNGECHPSYAIVLDNEGRMIKAANLGQEGQVVGDNNCPAGTKAVPSCSVLLRWPQLPACAWLYWEAGPMAHTEMPYGTVEVRINPDVKMSVSYMDRVVGLEGVNEDGKTH